MPEYDLHGSDARPLYPGCVPVTCAPAGLDDIADAVNQLSFCVFKRQDRMVL